MAYICDILYFATFQKLTTEVTSGFRGGIRGVPPTLKSTSPQKYRY